jgi:hypothetical protein
LLGKAEALPLQVIVVRVKDLRDDLGHRILLHGAHIVPVVEKLHVEVGARGGPQAQAADASAAVAGNIHVVRHGDHIGVIPVLHHMVLVVPALLDAAVEVDLHALVRNAAEPDLPAGQPEVGQLRLPAVHQFLPENAVLIAQ